MAKILCVLYEDPSSGYPPDYTRDSIPTLKHYPDGQTLPPMNDLQFTPGELLGCVSGELGLRDFLEQQGHEFIVTADKEGSSSQFEQELATADVVISQPFWPAYLTQERIALAKNLSLIITAGIGSDHIDLEAAKKAHITVAEVTYSNSISVAEHVVMMILALVRNYLPSYLDAVNGGWNIADCVSRSYDLEGMTVGSFGAGRIGLAVLKRLKPFDVKLHYTDRHRLSLETEQELGLIFHPTLEEMIKHCDILTLNVPLHSETSGIINESIIQKMKRGIYIINTARAQLCDRDAIVRACNAGHIAGYAGDVWFPQPAPANHPWRTMPFHGMTPHLSGSSLSAQARYAAGTQEILTCWLNNTAIREEYLVLHQGQLAGVGSHSYSLVQKSPAQKEELA